MSDANSHLPSNAVRNGLIAIGVFVVLLGALAFFNRGVRVPDCPGGDEGSCKSILMPNCVGDELDIRFCMQAVQGICRAACDPNTDWSQFSQCEIDQAMCLANGGGRLRCGRICD